MPEPHRRRWLSGVRARTTLAAVAVVGVVLVVVSFWLVRFVELSLTEQVRTRALERARGVIAAFDRPLTPYRAVRRARFNYKYDAFAHLARVAEWSLEPGEEE